MPRSWSLRITCPCERLIPSPSGWPSTERFAPTPADQLRIVNAWPLVLLGSLIVATSAAFTSPRPRVYHDVMPADRIQVPPTRTLTWHAPRITWRAVITTDAPTRNPV